MSEKPHVSASQLDMAAKCGEQWFLRYVMGKKNPPGIAMSTGSAVHIVGEYSLSQKRDNGTLPTEEEVKDKAAEAIITAVEENGLTLTSEEQKEGKKKVLGRAKDKTIDLSCVHLGDIAPIIEPVLLEHRFALEIPGYDYELVGVADVVETCGIRDLKTSGSRVAQESVDRSTQYTIYARWFRAKYGRMPSIFQDTVVKTKKPYSQIIETSRKEEDFISLDRRLENFSIMVEKGVFHPASSMAWWCSPKWCGYYSSCKYV